VKLPEKLKVGPITYDIQVMPLADVGVQGAASVTTQTILLDKDLAFDTLRATALHEVLHAVMRLSSVESHKYEEELLQRLEHGMLGVLRDNPAFVKWLLEVA